MLKAEARGGEEGMRMAETTNKTQKTSERLLYSRGYKFVALCTF